MKPCLFLDRDGVIIHNVPYTNDHETVVLNDGIIPLIHQARAKNFSVICVTNQSGIGRGLVTMNGYNAITARMNELLLAGGCRLDHIYYSPYFEGTTEPEYLLNPEWRKPAPGMIHQACVDYEIDLEKSFSCRDRATDVEAAFRGGIKNRIMIASSEFSDEILKVPSGIEFKFLQSLHEISL